MTSRTRYLPLVVLLLSLTGCKNSKKRALKKNKAKNTNLASLNIPLASTVTTVNADESISNFFDQDIEKFVHNAQQENIKTVATAISNAQHNLPNDSKDFTFLHDALNSNQEFKTVYFDFDNNTIRKDQEQIVAQDAANARTILTEARKNNTQPTIVIEGHACHSAGSSTYNLALSEERAKKVADWFVSQNVPQENIKIVGRGFEMPAMVNGKVVDGGKEQQWANRRVEVHVLYS